MAEQKFALPIAIQVAEVLYDVRNKAHLTGQAREADDGKNYATASNMMASEDDDITYQLKRSLADYFSGLKTLLGEFLDEDNDTADNLIDSIIEDEGKLSLSFRLPSNFNSASADAVGKGIHKYLVSNVLADWFSITNKADAEDYVTQGIGALESARRALYKRKRPERPTFDDSTEQSAGEQ